MNSEISPSTLRLAQNKDNDKHDNDKDNHKDEDEDDGVQYGTLVMHVPVTYYKSNPAGTLAVHSDWAAYDLLPGRMMYPDGSRTASVVEWQEKVSTCPHVGDLQQVLDTFLLLNYIPLNEAKHCTLNGSGGYSSSSSSSFSAVTCDHVLDYLSNPRLVSDPDAATAVIAKTKRAKFKTHRNMTFRHRSPVLILPSLEKDASASASASASATRDVRHGNLYSRGTRRQW